MADERYNRWQGLAIGQLSVALALISATSIAGLGAGLSLLKDQEFMLPAGCWRYVFGVSQLLLVAAIFFSTAAVITRTLDFRLTARKVRNDKDPSYDKSLVMFGGDKDAYGRWTWRCFWLSCIFFALGMIFLVASSIVRFADKLH